jgi:hypothetical protein
MAWTVAGYGDFVQQRDPVRPTRADALKALPRRRAANAFVALH